MPRVEHVPDGDPCSCGLAVSCHRKRDRNGRKVQAKQTYVLGLDGEGYTNKDGDHLYTYLAASNSDGSIFFDVENRNGLTTKEILDFLLSLPKDALKVGFALGYDYTKWLEDLRDQEIYLIYRPEKRTGRHGPRAVRIVHKGSLYAINLVATKLTVQGGWDKDRSKWKQSNIIWDLFRFYQRSFVNSLKEWEVGAISELIAIQKMKERRGNFKAIGNREKRYCQSEVRLLAQLAEKLINACIEAGIPLTDYFGAGSLGAATLKNGLAKEQIVKNMPSGMKHAVTCAFFGGRFEQSVRGIVEDSHGFDLASAYPYAETQLPCLACGTWKHVKGSHAYIERQIRKARASCVRYKLLPRKDIKSRSFWKVAGPEALAAMPDDLSEHVRVSEVPWGPFPFRLRDGSILFPVESAGGWVWHFEALAVLDNPHVWPNLQLSEAWVYQSRCNCPAPYLEEISNFYLARLRWGKEGPGLCLKKGLASRYGKAAQTIGRAPFHCAVKAGLQTSHTRSEILRAIALDPTSCLSVATDGIIVRKHLTLRKPNDTHTDIEVKETKTGKIVRKPLGMWEYKESGPIFLLRPGMRFAIERNGKTWRAKEEEEGKTTTAARGVGVMKLHHERPIILKQWIKNPGKSTTVPRGAIFHGAKLCVGKTKEGCRRLDRFGRWAEAEPFKVSYLPLPKRPAATKDQRLLTWALTRHEGESCPYDRMVSKMRADILELERAQDEAECQPDGGDDLQVTADA